MDTHDVQVPQEGQGLRLDLFLTDHIEGSRSFIQTIIKDGHVILNGKKAKANSRLNETGSDRNCSRGYPFGYPL